MSFSRKVDYWMRLFSIFTGYVEHRMYRGWSGYLPFYGFTCDKHGYVIDYKHGHREKLSCPKCVDEKIKAYGLKP